MIRRLITLVLVLVLFLFLYSFCSVNGPKNTRLTTIDIPQFSSSKLEGQLVAVLNLKDLNESSISFPEKDKISIVSFWATWCAPCMAELPHLIELHHKYKEKGVRIIGVSLDYTEEDLLSVIQRYKIPYPIVMMTPEISNAYSGVYSIPFTVILDGNKVVSDVNGYQKKDYFEEYINQILKERSINKGLSDDN